MRTFQILLVLTLTASASCDIVEGLITRPQSLFCTEDADCSQNSMTPYCDESGRLGIEGACTTTDPDTIPDECSATKPCAADSLFPVCNIDASMCAPCSADPSVCQGDSVCRSDGACGCATNADCKSKICDASAATYGACVAESDIIYVDQGGMDMQGCGAAGALGPACKTIQFGVTEAGMGSRSWVRVAKGAGAYLESVATMSGQSVGIVGDTDRPEVTKVGMNVPVFACTGGKLTMNSMRIKGSDGIGIDASGGCELDVQQSEIIDNNGGGVRVNGGGITLINNIIKDNGVLNSSPVGGVDIAGSVQGTIAFNTIVSNVIANNGKSPGVHCGLSQAEGNIVAANNLVQLNTAPAEKRQAAGGDGCTWFYSALGPDDTALMVNNNTLAPCTVVGADGRLNMNDTACQDKGDPAFKFGSPASKVTVDIDGEPRPSPKDGNPDIGADEIQQ